MTVQFAKHLRVAPQDLCEDVVVCGDPARAKRIASFMTEPRLAGENREYHTWVGTVGQRRIAAVSHGVGAAGAAICFEELVNLGAKRIVRVGTAGALQDDLGIGDAVLATAAIRLDGVSHMMVPPEFPAVADPELLRRLQVRCEARFPRAHAGVVLTTALFYPSLLPDQMALYRQAGALAVEMETSALFVIGTLRKVATASLVVLDGNPRRWEEGMYHPDGQAVARATNLAIQTVLETLSPSPPPRADRPNFRPPLPSLRGGGERLPLRGASPSTAVSLARSSTGSTALVASASGTRHSRPHGGPRARVRRPAAASGRPIPRE